MTQFSAQAPLPFEAGRRIRQEVGAGEMILWTGQPALLRLVQCAGIVSGGGVFFVLLGAGICAAAAKSAAWSIAVVGLTSGVFIGGYFLWQSFQDFRAGCKMVYLITDRRVLILPAAGAVSLSPEQVQMRQMKANRRGYGDLYFACLEEAIGSAESSQTKRDGFLGIPDVPAVDALLRATFGSPPVSTNSRRPLTTQQPMPGYNDSKII